MRGLMGVLTRFMPLMFFIVVVISLAQFIAQHSLSLPDLWRVVQDFLSRNWLFLFLLATFLWAIVFLGLRYEKSSPTKKQKARSWDRDALDRLTNRDSLEDALRGHAEPTSLDSEALAKQLKHTVIGQDLVCEEIALQLRRRLALRQRGKPVGVFLLAGPPGTGKTYLAKQIAIAMDIELVHLDMTQFARGGAASTQLFGSSKGYVGSDTYGRLTSSLKQFPSALVLLDEFEKAHPEVHKNFLTAWNDGFITEASDGRQIATTRAIFVLTTNAASHELAEAASRYPGNTDQLRAATTEALLNWGFAPELLNRIDRIFTFRALEGLDVARVTALEIEAMVESYGLEIAENGIDSGVLGGIVRRHQQAGPNGSIRDIVRAIEETIADSLIDARNHGAVRVKLREANGRVEAIATPMGE